METFDDFQNFCHDTVKPSFQTTTYGSMNFQATLKAVSPSFMYKCFCDCHSWCKGSEVFTLKIFYVNKTLLLLLVKEVQKRMSINSYIDFEIALRFHSTWTVLLLLWAAVWGSTSIFYITVTNHWCCMARILPAEQDVRFKTEPGIRLGTKTFTVHWLLARFVSTYHYVKKINLDTDWPQNIVHDRD